MAEPGAPERDRGPPALPVRCEGRSWRLLLALFAASAIVSACHFTDNIVRFDVYPGPAWVTRFGIGRYWVIMTLIGALGMLAYRRGSPRWGVALVSLYGMLNFVVLGHYLYSSHMHPVSVVMHVLIIGEVVTGAAVIAVVIWIYRARRFRSPQA